MLLLQLFVVVAVSLSLAWNRYLALRRNIKLARDLDIDLIIRRFTFVYWTWNLGYEPFERLGSDTIVTVAPGGITLHTCSPEIIAQIGRRHKDFLKPTRLYKIVDAFGSNLVSSNGQPWRRQRKAITPSFTEGNNSLVWTESIHQTRCMLRRWEGQLQGSSKIHSFNIQDDLKTLAFHILNRAGFGVRLQWPGIPDTAGEDAVGNSDTHTSLDGDGLEGGQGMRFGDAMLVVVDHLKELFIFPKWVLKHAPSKSLNTIWLAHKEIESYLGKYISCQQNSIREGETGSLSSPNIRSSLIENTLRHTSSANTEKTLTMDEIVGNCLTSRQALRLFPPANIMPKHTALGGPKILRYNDREIHVPSTTALNILAPSTHQNPSYWPHQPSTSHSGNDLDEFNPERWFSAVPDESHHTDSGVDLGSDADECLPTRNKFFTPKKGAFIPYSIGQRECIGKRFAQIEMLAVMAVIFRDWTVELVVDGEEELSDNEKMGAWEKTRENAKAHLKTGMEHYMTMQLKKGLIPLSFVKRR
ncbi:Cytochrome P450 [Hyphodiscus hymeniophilus]|uniref:Cytochrome P450 n=1 Tax=Hyphodiscus hymeniophilus TaxID=353542 RepID=A0A9P7AYB5_9HELO|nr:Cytochrome P450 [Hyphodiscus hymeniophilus]